ncbi:unnamed protein product [Boreogadus saida]
MRTQKQKNTFGERAGSRTQRWIAGPGGSPPLRFDLPCRSRPPRSVPPPRWETRREDHLWTDNHLGTL